MRLLKQTITRWPVTMCLLVVVAAGVGPHPVPFEDLFVCMEDPELREDGMGVCEDFDQIAADVFHAYWDGRPVVLLEGDPVAQVGWLLDALDDEAFDPPYYNGPLVWDALGDIWDYLNP